MKPNLLISYSRRQTPFIDRLADQLEDNGYSIWLDYQSLVPAKPWKEQIEAGVDGADVILLVVSKESIASKNVKPEWKRALDKKKRVILLIFEAVPLPVDLQNCEWVDFRTKYKKRVKQLMTLLGTDSKLITAPPPQTGFKAPKRFWIALALSAVVVLGSLPTWWTLFVPYILVPLPWQIYRRSYIYSRVIPALFLLPFIFGATYGLFFYDTNSVFYPLVGYADNWFIPSSLASWVLAGLLMTVAMQRRAMPEAARVRFANPLVVDIKKPRSVAFAIDHAPEDGRYAEDLRRGLEPHGHRLAGEGEKPEAIFVLISGYKKRTDYDPDKTAVYPVILQAVKDLHPALSRIQWIDFRNGIRNINKLAKLLPEPERMLKALAVPPTGAQEIFPFAVNAMQYFYLITGILGGGGLLTSMISLGLLVLRGDLATTELVKLFLVTLNGLMLLWAVTFTVRALRTRIGGASALYPLLVLTLTQLVIHTSVYMIITFSDSTDDTVWSALFSAATGPQFSTYVFPIGLLILIPILLFRWRDLYRWLPRRQDFSVSRLESILLLYTPSRQGALVFHVIFHAILLLTYALLNVLNATRLDSISLVCTLPFILAAFGVRWLARRISK